MAYLETVAEHKLGSSGMKDDIRGCKGKKEVEKEN